MRLTVNIVPDGSEPLPEGARVRVEVRDTSFADALPNVVASASGVIAGSPTGGIEGLTLAVDSRPDSAVVWVHVDVGGTGRVAKGDFVSMEADPLPVENDAHLAVRVREV